MKGLARAICCLDGRSNNSSGVGPLPVLISPFLRFTTWFPDKLDRQCRNRPHLLEIHWSAWAA